MSSIVHHVYTLSNQGDKPVAIRSWKAISGHGEVRQLPETLQPGTSAQFVVVLPLPGKLGHSQHRFALFTDEPDVERYRFSLSGFVMSLTEDAHAVLDFGAVHASNEPTRELTLTAREQAPLALERVVDAPAWLDARISGTQVVARIRKDSSLGAQAGIIRIATNLPQQPFVEVTARAIVEGRLKPSIYAIGMKPAEVGTRVASDIDLAYTGTSDLRKLKLEAPSGWTTTRSACPDTATAVPKCVRITLARVPGEPGRVNGSVRFELDGEPSLSIPFGAIALGVGQTVRELVIDERRKVEQDNADIARNLRDVVSAPPPSVPAPDARVPVTEKIAHSEGSGPVRLTWTARNDGGIFGYLVYRSTDRAGPFVRISEKPVRADRAETSAAARYEFVDTAVAEGQTYYYYIDTLASNGNQQRFSPVLSKKVTR